jgi:hypothetical protein
MRRYLVVADLSALGAPPMPVAEFWFLLPAWAFAALATAVTGLQCDVI